MTISRGKKRLFALLALACGLVLGLVIAEILLRAAGYSSPEFYSADETFGYALIPGMTGTYSKEGRSSVVINSDGFRDVEQTIAKPADTYRIAVLGDSYVEALQVESSERFTEFLSAGLNQCGAFDKKVEILTFGVSGYGTAQELLMLREKVWKYSPDLVMLVVTTNNDIADNLRELKQTPIPYFKEIDGRLVLDESFRQEKTFIARNSGISRLGIWLKNHLRFVQAVGEISLKIKYWYKDRGGGAHLAAAAGEPADEVGIDNQIYLEPTNETWKPAWSITEKIIAEINREIEQRGAEFLVVTASNGVQVLPDVKQREQFAARLKVPDLFYPEKRIAAFGAANDIPVINLAPILGAYSAHENANLHGFEGNIGYGHWNQLGHRVAGQAIAQQVCEGAVK